VPTSLSASLNASARFSAGCQNRRFAARSATGAQSDGIRGNEANWALFYDLLLWQLIVTIAALGGYMEIRKILADLKEERNRIVRAIAALEMLDSTEASVPRGRPATTAKAAPKQPSKRGLTPAGRRRLSVLMKARWAAMRKTAAKPAPKPTPGRRRMSAAARRKIAEAQRARWAAQKKAAAKNAPDAKKAEVVAAPKAE
jgi:hypothetical protein